MTMMKAPLCPATASCAARPSQPRAQQIMSERKRAYQKYGPAVCSPRRFRELSRLGPFPVLFVVETNCAVGQTVCAL